jgi:hypothetical protein
VQQKVVEQRVQLDAMEEVFKEEHVAIGRLDQKTWEFLEEAKESHVVVDAHISICAKLQEDLNWHVDIISQSELKVAMRDLEQEGKEEEINSKLARKHDELEPRADDLSAHEATLEMEWERLRRTSATMSSPSHRKKAT